MKYYRPLPSNLTVRNSNIEGLGLFATKDIALKTDLGITHILNKAFEDGLVRTPLGGFINYSDTPNCKLDHGPYWYTLFPIKDIKKDEELTLKYNSYNPTLK